MSFLLRLAMLLFLVAGVAGAALVWRLQQGPLSVPPLARLAESLAADVLPGELVVGRTLIAWSGWGGGEPLPVVLRLEEVRLRDASGRERAALPVAEVSLSVPWLLRGVVAPSRLTLVEPRLAAIRAASGAISLDLGGVLAPVTEPSGDDPEVAEFLRAVLAPRGDEPLSALRELDLRGGEVTLRDEESGIFWALLDPRIALRRGEGGGLEGTGEARIRLNGQEIPVRLSAGSTGSSTGDPPVVEAVLELPRLSPVELAAALPVLRPMAALQADVSARITARYALEGGGLSGSATARVGEGRVALTGANSPFAGLDLQISGDERRLSIDRLVLRLPAGPSGRGTVLSATGGATRAGDTWRGEAELTLDEMPVEELRRFWPEALAPGAREWLVTNITRGTARNGRWRLGGEAAADFSTGRLTTVTGTVEASDVTVHWLRPVPPADGIAATVRFVSADEIVVESRGGRQRGTGLTVAEGRVRITGLVPEREMAAIELRAGGPLADLLTLLQHPRLHLFDKRPLDLKEPSGNVDGTVTLNFPLIADLPVDQLKVSARGRVVNGRIASLVAGLPVERANLDVTVDLNGMKLAGTAALGPVPGRVEAELDFREGPPTQVTERVRAEGRTDAANLAVFGLETGDVVTGPVAVNAVVERRRNGEGVVNLRGDLRGTRMTIEALGFSKAPGLPATADAVLRLSGENLRSLDNVRVEAPNLLVRAGVSFAPGNRLTRIELSEGRVGPSRFTGTVLPPEGPRAPWRAALQGPLLDARKTMESQDRPGPRQTQPPLELNLDFERVMLAEARELVGLRARLDVNAEGTLTSLRARGSTPRGGSFEAAIVPRGAGRAMELVSADAGALLRGLNVLEHVVGGQLRVTGGWATNAPDAPLRGTAEMTDFSVRDAPSIGKLLQALTIYGIAEAARGPDLGFSRLIAPFTLTEEALSVTDAQAFSASLGLTARGRILRRQERIEMEGTVVPAYIFNSLLGRIPVIGRIFSPEAGGGLFAASFRVVGPLRDPQVAVNPLSALTPGFLRGLFPSLDAPRTP